MRIELLWFEDCPNHQVAEEVLVEVLREAGLEDSIIRIEVPDLETGNAVCFPGSPTIRIDGVDIEPGWEPCADCSPRCRLYSTVDGLRGVPERPWIQTAVRAATR